ncbi:DUF4393 domain-containing protein [Cupriavidus basilensis]|uniref:DUF4393 domain-containing protein n=1 Tax=Cupriavidus basilensis TaxID=68895 RepID=UPI0020A67124|nr:DUF4393 domain-containing protein [Cupriavidus basilensis]MCP3019084.1 DUF4393 domain-containing protein [Cupriavidus basilensis]
MGEEQKESGNVTEMAQAVAAVAKEIPVYRDLAQPAVQELGRGLVVVAKVVTACLAPAEGLVWGVDKIKDFVRERVAKKLENVPPEEIQQPKPHIAVPAIEALRYTGAEESLSDLYANLLATSMDKATAYRAHPGFVDMIKNMCPDEARVMRLMAGRDVYPVVDIWSMSNTDSSFIVISRYITLIGHWAGCEHPLLTSTYLDNLERLGLLWVDMASHLSHPEAYSEIENHPDIKAVMASITGTEGRRPQITKGRITTTDLGKQFIRACVLDKESQLRN